ncbi:hypothetical protein [Myceligenerans crystallogenes]|uniref:Flagellin N-terminal-like domain-containing protein n=1 Tax=Myceligenerans crystallogenes TaxID=316335 RepID=A0ABN2N6R1_9MICO
MQHLVAMLHLLGLDAMDRRRARADRDPERGNVTMEQVLWAVAVIVIVGIVVTAVTNYVTAETGKLTPSGF